MPVADGAQRTQQRLQRVPAVAAEAAAAARDEAAVLGRGRGKPASRVRPLYPGILVVVESEAILT
jgi:hypothetical protein